MTAAQPTKSWTMQRVIDRGEQALALLLYLFLVRRIWPEDLSLDNLAPALVLVSEGVIVFFLIIRRSTGNISLRPQEWAAALIGTTAPLLVVKTAEPGLLAPGAFLLLFGMVTQIGAKLSLRRSFGLVPANRGVRTSGAYRYVRHPMYLGYMISHVGYVLIAPSFWNIAVYAVCWIFLALRVRYEEAFLSADPAYRAFMEKVRYRLVPGVY